MTRGLRAGLWWFVIASLIGAITFLQLDLLSQAKPSLARFVPPAFQSRAASVRAISAMGKDDWGGASEAAERAVLRRPIPASSLVTLSLAQSRAGKVNDSIALAALAAAGGRGWRDRLAQSGALAMALDARRFDIAAMRFDALWRIKAVGGMTEPAMQAAFAVPEVRTQLAERFAAGVPWAGDLVGWAIVNASADDLVDFMEQSNAKGAAPDCVLLGAAALRGLQAGKPVFARKVWSRFCRPARGDNRFIDGQGQKLVGGPFDWTFPPGAGVSIAVTPEGALQYRARDFVRVALAERWIDLPPGMHTMTLRHSGRDPVLRVECIGEGLRTRTDVIPMAEGVARFLVPANCATQHVTIEVDFGEGTIHNPVFR